ncbi:hypothetical protein AAFH68_48630 [Flavobacterium sp. CGRL1]
MFNLLIFSFLHLKKNLKNLKNPILDQRLLILFSFDISVTLTHKKMGNMKLKFEDFESEKLSKNEKKMIRGGEEPGPDKDPIRTGGGTVG